MARMDPTDRWRFKIEILISQSNREKIMKDIDTNKKMNDIMDKRERGRKKVMTTIQKFKENKNTSIHCFVI